jgi:hypothetical protein
VAELDRFIQQDSYKVTSSASLVNAQPQQSMRKSSMTIEAASSLGWQPTICSTTCDDRLNADEYFRLLCGCNGFPKDQVLGLRCTAMATQHLSRTPFVGKTPKGCFFNLSYRSATHA